MNIARNAMVGAVLLACTSAGENSASKTDSVTSNSPSVRTDPLFRDLAPAKPVSFDPNDPYRDFAYAPEMRADLGPFGSLPPQFKGCHKAPVDTLRFDDLTLELRGDSLRGFSQETIEGQLMGKIALIGVTYDTVARLLSFDLPASARTLFSYDLIPSCDSLVGVVRNKTAYHPQDEKSGVSAMNRVLHKRPRL